MRRIAHTAANAPQRVRGSQAAARNKRSCLLSSKHLWWQVSSLFAVLVASRCHGTRGRVHPRATAAPPLWPHRDWEAAAGGVALRSAARAPRRVIVRRVNVHGVPALLQLARGVHDEALRAPDAEVGVAERDPHGREEGESEGRPHVASSRSVH